MMNELKSWDDLEVRKGPTRKKATAKKKPAPKTKPVTKTKPVPRVFGAWDELNTAVLKMGEHECADALAAEIAGPNRRMFKLRIHSRLNKVRAHRERRDLLDT